MGEHGPEDLIETVLPDLVGHGIGLPGRGIVRGPIRRGHGFGMRGRSAPDDRGPRGPRIGRDAHAVRLARPGWGGPGGDRWLDALHAGRGAARAIAPPSL